MRDVYHQSVLPPTPSQSSAEQEILKLRREWAIAYSKGDTEALARIETSDFVVVSDSRINNQRQYERIEQAVKENIECRWGLDVQLRKHGLIKGSQKLIDEYRSH